MERFFFEVSGEDKGLRLDQYIIKNIQITISRSRIKQLINAGEVTVNQKKAKAHYKVKENDAILINVPPPARPKEEVLPEEIPLKIVFEDEDLLIIDKPAGLVTHPATGNYTHTLVNALVAYGCALSTVNGPLRPGIVHRLDKDTSGLLVIAKNDFAHQGLAGQFQRHTVKRRYIALVEGRVAQNEGVIDLPLARHPQNRQKIAVSFLKKGRAALTRYKVLKRFQDSSLLELSPHTGRTHQLRVHLKSCGHPIVGDTRYGRKGGLGRMALHATGLGFEHPRTKEFVEFHSDIPQCFQEYICNI